MNRRQFIITAAAAGIAGASAPVWARPTDPGAISDRGLDELLRDLSRDWCDGLLRLQVFDPDHPESHGAFRCPACGFFHGRCGDAVLPLLALAAQTGEARYRDAALRVTAWTRNVSRDDGSWSNELDPTSWKGTTIFTAIAFAEALEWHENLLDPPTRDAWRERLKSAGDFIFTQLKLDGGSGEVSLGRSPTNINYGIAGGYALALLGRLLGEDRFRERSAELVRQARAFFTPQNRLLFGEGHPANQKTAKGCYAVDLGYNVEESLPNLVHYALLAEDPAALETAASSFKSHLEFMLPDGAWDNSWGTRSFKWTYWGSRTTDGCQSALVRLATRDPVFATAALRNAELLRACTREGLLHGGPHYASHQVKPCVHHTFAHAKTLAGALHYRAGLKGLGVLPALPRGLAQGVKTFPELAVTLAAIGPWRATFSGYDWAYKPGLFQAGGGVPGILWHERLGPLLSGSLAHYLRLEGGNMQAAPDAEDFPLSLRVERRLPNGDWYTNLHDRQAQLRSESTADALRIAVQTRLLSPEEKDPPDGRCALEIVYTLTHDRFTVSARPLNPMKSAWSLVIPVVASSEETATHTAPDRWEIRKPAGRLILSSTSRLERMPTRRERVFNLVPGLEALPLQMVSSEAKSLACALRAAK